MPIAARGHWLRPLLVALVTAGLVELVLLRVGYRIGLFVPRGGPLQDAYGVLTWLGSFAFDLVSVSALVALAGLAVAARRQPLQALAYAAVLGFAVALPFASAALRETPRLLFAIVVIVTVALVALPALRNGARDRVERLGLLGVALALVAVQYAGAVADISQALGDAVGPSPALLALRVAEVAAVAAAFPLGAAALRAGHPSWLRLLVAVVLASGVAAIVAVQPYLGGILILWASGMSLLLPLPMYAAAFGAYVVCVLAESASRERAHRAIGAVLLLVAGVVPQSSAHAVVAIVALALLADRPGSLVPAARQDALAPAGSS